MIRHRLTRRLGTTLIGVGVLLFVYAAVVLTWRDPVTDVYTAWQQRGLREGLARQAARWERAAAEVQAQQQKAVQQAQFAAARAAKASKTAAAAKARAAAEARQAGVMAAREAAARAGVRVLAKRYAMEEHGHDGRAFARIQVPRLGLSTVVVEGTDYWSSLSKGPGHYPNTAVPGLGRTVAIAGHRTTFAAPFRHIDELEAGDPITLRLPYGTFSYHVVRHRIVDNGDWSIIRNVGHDQLVLSACHPLYSASQRYVVFARLDSFQLPGGGSRVPV